MYIQESFRGKLQKKCIEKEVVSLFMIERISTKLICIYTNEKLILVPLRLAKLVVRSATAKAKKCVWKKWQ